MDITAAPDTRRLPAGTFTAIDGLIALAAVGTAFAAYLATLYPGLLSVGDATKFAFVGKVLGTPHAPGYPLYVMVSHLFSYVPWGTLAYRMNAFSALLGALTAGLSYLIARELGASRPAALASALALAFGDAFWSRAIYAKAYTLHVLLVSAGVLQLLRWDRTRRVGDLYLAAGIFALAVGNHLTVIALLPALVLFPLITEPRTTLRPRTMLVVALLVLAGLSQYLFILVRTLQHAPYLEARAESLGQLWDVVTARRWSHELAAYSASELRSTRIPIIWGLVVREIRWVGAIFIVPAAVLLAWRAPRRALLHLLGAVGVVALTVNMSSEEDHGFLLPAFALLWPLAALGIDLFGRALGKLHSRAAVATIVLLAIGLPADQFVRNYEANDHHRDTFDTRYFEALFAELPQKAAILSDEYRLNMMVLYKLIGERAAGTRDVRMIPADSANVKGFRDRGYEVFAFEHARDRMREFGALFALVDGATPESATLFRQRALYQLLSTSSCLDAGNLGWRDISEATAPAGRLTVRIDNARPFESRVIVYVGGDREMSPALVEGAGHYRLRPTLSVQRFDESGEARARLAAAVASDRAVLPASVLSAPHVSRAEVVVNDEGQFVQFGIDFGPSIRGAAALAVVDRDESRRASFCSHALTGHDAWPADQERTSLLPARHVELASGWHEREARPDGTIYRWTTERAVVIVPLSQPRAATLLLDGEPFDYPGRRGEVALIVNGQALEVQPLPAGIGSWTWSVPESVWRPGLNEIVLEVRGAKSPALAGASGDPRILGLAVSSMELAVPGAR